jgi:hypothetical protein
VSRAPAVPRPPVASPPFLSVPRWIGTRLAWIANSSRIVGSRLEAGPPAAKARRSSAPRPRSTSRSRPLASGSGSRRSSTSPVVLWAVRVAMTRQAPPGRISRLWLWSVRHRCRRLAGSSAMVRTGRLDGCSKRITPTGGSSSRWMSPEQTLRPVTVQSRSGRHAKEAMLSWGSMVQVPVGRERDRSVVTVPGSRRSRRAVMTVPVGSGPGARTSVPRRPIGGAQGRRDSGAGGHGGGAGCAPRHPGWLATGAPALRL